MIYDTVFFNRFPREPFIAGMRILKHGKGGRADAKKACHGAYQKAMRKTQVAALRAAVPADRYHIALLWNRFFSFAVAFRSGCADRSAAASFVKMKRKDRRRNAPSKSLVVRLEAAFNLAGTKAASANVHFTRRTVDNDTNGLNVGSPSAPGLPVGMADQITGHHSFIAYFAKLTHAFTPPYRL